MGRTRKPIAEPTERRHRDAVTGELVTVVLDDVRRALERIHAAIDGQMLDLNANDRARLVAELQTLLDGMKPHT